ncbi:MAG: DUF4189 domain-containing protein [Rhodopseudomonas sp.]|nr:DUF4189 domain-containing protein [Rhodopseudomonas sp.]
MPTFRFLAHHRSIIALTAAVAAIAFMLSTAAILFAPSAAKANLVMARTTGKACSACHVPMQEPRLNHEGQAFKECGYQFCRPGAVVPYGGRSNNFMPSHGYGAIAVGSAGREGHSGTSFRNATQAEADRKALNGCADRASNCRIVARYTSGACGYVTVGKPGKGTCWGVGSTPAEARLSCEAQGCGCKEPIGSCNR